jgi:hypothetical protein
VAFLATLASCLGSSLAVIGEIATAVVATFAAGLRGPLTIICEVTRIFIGRHCWYLLRIFREAVLPLHNFRQALRRVVQAFFISH